MGDLGAARLDDVELVMAVGEAFDVKISGEDAGRIRHFRTKQDLLDHIRERKEGGE